MFNSVTQCFLRPSEHDQIISYIFPFANSVVAGYALVINFIALIGIWLVYKHTMKRTPKLLLSLFATNLLVVLAVASLSVYHFIDGFLQSWLFSAHILLIVFLVLWSSTNVCLVTVDRYLIVIHGTRYRLWKKYFHALVIAEFVTIACYSMFIYFSLKFMGCTVNFVNLSGVVVFITSNLVASFIANILLTRYIRMNTSLAGRTRNMERGVATTVTNMTISDGICQVLLIATTILYICSLTISSRLSKYVNVLLFLLPILSLLRCGTVPMTYILRNKRILNTLCCKRL